MNDASGQEPGADAAAPLSLQELRAQATYNWKPAAYLDVYDLFLTRLRQ